MQGYKELYAKKWSFTKELAYQIEAGLQKMFEAKADVNKMKAELAVKNQDLAISAKEAEALLKQISESTAIAEKEKQKVAVIVDAVSGSAAQAGAAVLGQVVLSGAQPLLIATAFLPSFTFLRGAWLCLSAWHLPACHMRSGHTVKHSCTSRSLPLAPR